MDFLIGLIHILESSLNHKRPSFTPSIASVSQSVPASARSIIRALAGDALLSNLEHCGRWLFVAVAIRESAIPICCAPMRRSS